MRRAVRENLSKYWKFKSSRGHAMSGAKYGRELAVRFTQMTQANPIDIAAPAIRADGTRRRIRFSIAANDLVSAASAEIRICAESNGALHTVGSLHSGSPDLELDYERHGELVTRAFWNFEETLTVVTVHATEFLYLNSGGE
jgi:hypothetical protein